MGKILTTLKNPFRNFNLESRAHKMISQPRPNLAPKYEKDQQYIDRLLKEYSDHYANSLKKNEQLEKNLKNVYVTSKDKEINAEANSTKPLPLNRSQVEEFEYGVKEPDKIPIGKTTLRIALDFITKNQSDPKEYNAKSIAEMHSLSKEKVENILKYFRVFEVYVPKEKMKASFAGPSFPHVEIKQRLPKTLPPGKNTNEKKN